MTVFSVAKNIIKQKEQLLAVALLILGSFLLVTKVASGAPTPIAAYNFNETSGTVLNDISGNGQNGQVSGAAWSMVGKNAGALSFDGVNDWVTVADSNKLNLTSGMTLEAWVKPTVTPSGWKSIILKERPGDFTYSLYGNITASRPAGEVVTSSGKAEVRGTAKIATGAWTHLTTTYNGTTLRMYVNGVLVGSKNISGNIITSTGVLRFGGNGVWGDEFFNGLIDDVRIYDVALSQAEIQTDMNTPVANDIQAPSVALSAPNGGATVSGTTVSLAATAADNVGVTGVQFKVDGNNVSLEDTAAPYSVSWNSTTVTNGSHSVTAVARDAAGNQTTSTAVSVTVDNPTTITLTQPQNGQTIVGTSFTVLYSIGNPTAGDHAHFRLDGGTTIMDMDGDGSYIFNNVAPGSHSLVARVANTGHTEIAASEVVTTFTTTAPDATPPIVSVTAPQAGTTVSGILNVTADATDNVAVAGVQFKLDDTNLGSEATTSPYAVPWNTTTAANGQHTLTAIARDTTNNQTTSANVVVTVNNTDPRAQVGEWSPVLNWPIIPVHSSLLPNGKVLMWDEENGTTQPKLWDPVTQVFSDTPQVPAAIFCGGQISLDDGRILVVGGHSPSGGEVGIKDTYVYDPTANTWIRTGDMTYARWYPAVAKLSDGKIAIFSGQITTSNFADKIEIYNPATGTTSVVSNIDTVQLREEEYPIPFHLPNGKILVMSPEYGAAQLFDAAASTWTNVNSLPLKFGSAVQYRPGKIMMSGGGTAFNAPSQTTANTLDMTSGDTPAWVPTSSMNSPRYFHGLVNLPTGKVFAVGGATEVSEFSNSGVLQTELWDPDTGSWSVMASMTRARLYHSAAMLLPDGRVLSAGGGRLSPVTNELNAQVYSPAYLFKGSRPTITAAPSAVAHGSTFTMDSPNAADITSVTLVNLANPTHSVDMSQIFKELTFTKTAGQLTVNAPLTTNEVPAGYYMVFAVNSNGVPSVAKIIKFSPTADSIAPTVSVTAPADGSTVAGSAVNLAATATDNVGIAGVQFKVDGNPVGAEDTVAPYAISWDSLTVANGTHTVTATVRDAAGNVATSAAITITVYNPPDTTPPVISNVLSGSVTTNSATITWTTNEVASSQVEYGTTTAYGLASTLDSVAVTSHSQNLTGLSLNTLYHYRVLSRDPSGNLAASADYSFTTSASSPQTITFDDIAGQNQVLNGEYPVGVINWGTNQWYLSAPWGQFTTKSISFNGSGMTSASFNFIAPKKLTSIQAYNGGASTTITLSCSGNPNKVVSLPSGGTVVTITTGWVNTCTTVTIANTNGWDTNFDNLIIE